MGYAVFGRVTFVASHQAYIPACPEVFYSFPINLSVTENSKSPSDFVLTNNTRPHRYDLRLWMMRRRALRHTSSAPVVLLSWPANVFVTLGFQCSAVLFLQSRSGTDQHVYSIARAHERGERFQIPHRVSPPALLLGREAHTWASDL